MIMKNTTPHRKGFTLIELLVVISVIAVLLGIAAVAISRGDRSMGVQSAQRSLSSMMNGARSQAALHQTEARLIIHVDPPAPGDSPEVREEKRRKYLRFMAIVRRGEDSAGNPIWIEVNDGVYLPQGVYFVPPPSLDAPAPNTPAEVLSASENYWSWNQRTMLGTNTMEHAYKVPAPAAASAKHHYIFVGFNSRGRVTSNITDIGTRRFDNRIVLSAAQVTAAGPRFEEKGDSGAVGGILRQNGSLTTLSEPGGFPDSRPVPPN
jgi:prepilin-type N-terminal cleavage/methylation domain-containing protein